MADQLRVKGTFDGRDIDKGLKDTARDFQGFGGMLSSLFGGLVQGGGIGAGIAGVQTLLQGVGQAFQFIKSKGIDANATLETAELQFATLMGSADEAKTHIAELYDFAAETPFEAEPVIEMSRLLQTFGGDALNTAENIQMIGDATAATNAPLDEMGFWVGRLYSSLQAGRPFGEASMRLMELAVLAPQTRTEMEMLAESGASADEIWAVFTRDMGRFTGAMEAQKNTFSGLASTVSDAFGIKMKGVLEPFFELSKSGLKTLADALESPEFQRGADNLKAVLQDTIDNFKRMVGGGINAFAEMDNRTARSLGRIAGYMSGLANLAVEWGIGIVQALADGIISAAGLIIEALNWIGDQIAYWLTPHSPPPLLPDLDDWGAGTAEAYLQGWTDADFGALRQFGDMIRNIIGNMGGNQALDVIPMGLAGTQAFADAIQEFKETGEVAESTYDRIREAAGYAGEEAEALARSYFELADAQQGLADAQDNLNEITERYNDILSPLRAELAALNNEQADLAGEDRIRSLQQLLTQRDLTPEQRAAAEAEIRQIQLEKQIRDVEAARDADLETAEEAVDTAQEAVDEAQAQLDLLTNTLGIQQATTDLLNEQRDLLESLVDFGTQLKEAVEDLPTALELALKPLLEQLEAVRYQQEEMRDLIRLAEIEKALADDTLTPQERKTLELERQEIAINRQIRALRAAEIGLDLSPLMEVPIVLKDTEDKAKGSGDAIGGNLADGITGGLSGLGEEVKGLFDPESLGLNEGIEEDLERIKNQFNEGFGEGETSFTNSLEALKTKFGEVGDQVNGFIDDLQPLLDLFTDIDTGVSTATGNWERFEESIGRVWTLFEEFNPLAQKVINPTGLMSLAFDGLQGSVNRLGEIFEENFGQSVPEAVEGFSTYWDEKTLLWGQNMDNAKTLIDEAVVVLLRRFGVDLPDNITHFSDLWTNKFDQAGTDVLSFKDTYVDPVLTEVKLWLVEGVPGALGEFGEMWKTHFDNAGTNLDNVYKDWIAPIFETLNNVLSITIPDNLADLEREWENRWTNVKNILEPLLDDDSGVRKFIEDVIDAVGDLKDTIKRFIDWLGTLSVPNPLQGITDTINSVTGGGGGGGGKDQGGTAPKLVADTAVKGPKATGANVATAFTVGSNSSVTTVIYDVDARGSSWTEGDFERIIRRVLDQTGREAEQFARIKR